jgi:pimeloyl-ACP methyl ester carboxylesterase
MIVKKKWFKLTAALLAAILMQSCMVPRAPETPIATRFYSISPNSTDHLIVLLPGRGDTVDAFDTGGFIEAMRASSIQADALAIDAHLGYYISGQLAERVREDVLIPYRQAGYESFTLVGTSLGGYGSLWLYNEFGDWFQGMLLVAPYLGPRDIIDSVAESDNLSQWLQDLDHEPTEDEYAWLWLQQISESESGLDGLLLLAFGEDDKFAKGAGIVSVLLPEKQAFRRDGSHNWNTWLELWRDVLESPAWAELSTTAD